MAHKKGVGSSKNGRESESKRLGVKIYLGKDHTLHAKIDGVVKFTKKKDNKSFVSILPLEK